MKILIPLFLLSFLVIGCESEDSYYIEEMDQEEGEVMGIISDVPVEHCPEIYDPVCGQPPMPECPEDMACAQVMPEVRTFSNICVMEREGAELVTHGECASDR